MSAAPIRLVLVVAAALVDADGRVLMAQRPEGKALAGLWEFPGGKVEAGERPEETLIRELSEELGIDVREPCLAPLTFASHAYPDFHLLMPLYICRRWEGIPQSREGQALRWQRPAASAGDRSARSLTGRQGTRSMVKRAKAAAETPKKPAAKRPAAEKPAPKPRKSRSTVPSPETLSALSQERLIALILEEVGQSPAFKKRVTAALASLQGPDAVAAVIDRRLAALEKARGFIDWQKRKAFAADLDATVTTVLADLRPLDTGMALDRLLRFLATADTTLERVDDSSGQVHAVYETAAEATAGIALALPPESAEAFATRLVGGLAGDGYGFLGSILDDLVPELPKDALDRVDRVLAEAQGALPKPTKTTGRDAFTAGQAAWESRYHRLRLGKLRQAVADARGDVDAFIALETKNAPDRPDVVAVAERLLEAGRAEEALDWIRRAPNPRATTLTVETLLEGALSPGASASDRTALEARILDALGRKDEAQKLRWDRFERTLDPQTLRDHLAKLPDFEDEEALERAFDLAEKRKDAHFGLYFLLAWPNLDRAARLVLARRTEWSGRNWEVLAPAADALAPDHPLAASLLYRELIDDILERARSNAYGHAARDLAKLATLAEEVEPGGLKPDHAAYVAALRKKHGRKYGFWQLAEK